MWTRHNQLQQGNPRAVPPFIGANYEIKHLKHSETRHSRVRDLRGPSILEVGIMAVQNER